MQLPLHPTFAFFWQLRHCSPTLNSCFDRTVAGRDTDGKWQRVTSSRAGRACLMRRPHHFLHAVLALGLIVGVTQVCGAYSVLTHEEVVDLLWKDDIAPLLSKRFPGATADDLKKAHAFAYGGSLIQDMGYYPFGSKCFSDLTHFVRSGDFIVNMINE